MNFHLPGFALMVSAALLLPVSASVASESASIRTLIASTYDQPDAKVQTNPVVVVGDHAVADWVQGKRGGRALMLRSQGQWAVVMCAGDGLRHAETLVQAGVPPMTAKAITQKLAQAEKNVSTSRRRQFDLFGTAGDPESMIHGQHPAHPEHKP